MAREAYARKIRESEAPDKEAGEQTRITPRTSKKKFAPLESLSKDDLLEHLETLKARGQDRMDETTEYGALIKKMSGLNEQEFESELEKFNDPKAA